MALLRVRAILDPSPKEVHQSVHSELKLCDQGSSCPSSGSTVPESSLASELTLASVASQWLDSIAPQPALSQTVTQEISLNQSTCVDQYFLTVLSEADFELIVDEIWANMKKKNKGWKTKNQLRQGLLSFMRSLPGNIGA